MTFLQRNYFKLLVSGFIGTSALLVSAMVDSLVAGRYLSAAGLTAVSLVSPYFGVSSFLSSMVLSGANISINQSVGAKDMTLANKQFSSALYAQLCIGLCFTLLSVIFLDKLPSLLGGTAQTSALMLEYLRGVVPYVSIFPISSFLSSIAFYDGDAKVAVSGQLLSIGANIALSIWLFKRIGIRGIALATVLSNCLGCAVYVLHFLMKKCPFRLIRAFSVKEAASMARIGLPGISANLFAAMAIAFVNNYIGRVHGEYVLYLFAISNTLVAAFTNIPGAAGEALAPMASLYFGEHNSLMQRRLLALSLKCALFLAAVAVIPVYCFPAAICRLYSVEPTDYAAVTRVLKMFSLSLFLSGVGNILVIYYMVNNHTGVAFVCSLLRCLIFFTVSFLILDAIAPNFLWFGVSLSETLTLLSLLAITSFVGKKESLSPLLLLDITDERRFRIWDFPSEINRFLACGKEAESELRYRGYADKCALDAALLLEEIGVLLSRYSCQVEVTLVMDENVELIVRDNSPKWDIANEDDALHSLDQYAALRILNRKAKKEFFRTVGCNKISFVLEGSNV